MIRTSHLNVTLGGKTIVYDATLCIPRGKVTVLLGPNGAGKSTLMRALAGLIATDDVHVDDMKLAAFSPLERARKLAFLPQDGAPAWNIAARELVALGRLPHRSPFAGESETDRAAIDAALQSTDCVHLASRQIETLSGGELARVKLARLIAGDPDWLLADEPLANLDPSHQRAVLALLRDMATAGKGVVLFCTNWMPRCTSPTN